MLSKKTVMAWQDARILRRKCLESMGPSNAIRKQPFISPEHGEPFLNEHGILASTLDVSTEGIRTFANLVFGF